MKYEAVLNTDDYKDFGFFEDGIGKYMVAKDAGATADGWMPLYFTECVQEHCDNAISREDVLDAISRVGLHKSDTKEVQAVAECLRAVEVLMPAASQLKTGHWTRELIRNEKGGCIGAKMICSECGNDNKHDEYMNHCPNCGAKMFKLKESGR